MTEPRTSIPYDSIAGRYDETRGGLVRGASFARSLAAALGAVDGVVLELGVGTGAVAVSLRELGYDVVGVDLSWPMVELARERLGPCVARGDGQRLPVRDGVLGAITMSWFLQLVGDQEAVFHEARRVLATGGRVAAIIAKPIEHEPCDLMPIERALGRRLRVAPDDRPAQAIAAAERAGLRLVLETETEIQAFEESPATIVERNRQRLFGGLIGLSDDEFALLVEPAIDELLALPDPDRPRRRVHSHPLLVFER